ncbi:hypothetical protein BJ165DRAFT_1599288 [Panaeolus papilionaceus]|nr:hypothetical protein BJ165DRAFT_1599288 [Panaeolus papilionaceus]
MSLSNQPSINGTENQGEDKMQTMMGWTSVGGDRSATGGGACGGNERTGRGGNIRKLIGVLLLRDLRIYSEGEPTNTNSGSLHTVSLLNTLCCVVMENLKSIKVTGEISLQEYKDDMGGYVVLVMGPTGAGKSSFLEAFAGPAQDLSLSSNQLAGYTQHINAFTVLNASRYEYTITLVDTPGFSDSKFSEKEILDMVNVWLNRNNRITARILYLVPINGTRLPGTQRKTLEMLQTFLKSSGGTTLKELTFVTTMWDTLYSEGALSRGQSNFEQLCDKQLKDFINEGATIVLDPDIVTGGFTYFSKLRFRTPQLYRDLYEPIKNALLEKTNIEGDWAQPDAQTNRDLRNILERNFRENNEILTKFIKQFNDYGDAPEGFEEVAQRLHQEIEIAMKHPLPQLLLREDSTALELTIPGRPATLREVRYRILEGAKKPWKKLFGSQR